MHRPSGPAAVDFLFDKACLWIPMQRFMKRAARESGKIVPLAAFIAVRIPKECLAR
jgi:hypothetical protein